MNILSSKEIIEIFLNPSSVAVIGASKSPLKGGHRIINNLLVNNYKGAIYPVNPNQEGQVFNLEFNKSVLDIEDEVDLAIFYSPNKVIPEILEECIQKGIKGAIESILHPEGRAAEINILYVLLSGIRRQR